MLEKIKNYLIPRLRNYGFWTSLLALIPMAIMAFGNAQMIPGNYEEISILILSLLVATGIVNNPTTKSKWYDDDK